ncbi:uncharacterized protein MYCFIDRAFT_78222 [Pseudocercospora fijiensis CIRAD86]|uniref:Uncharacterized protein n=1 Tax=Pseudocercospora fijiensis (strain CIRAD86) TaxID=383855 RepID=M2ZN21_PSEFD|nr:uncharacterized protein MYCFIDRAFT_78222 [Pseudocercospora fijiensis CIRAD86]EME80509.1 hypothetical protein MYCFIDRAFT_78222 [Pseudocercospora fijiensis CIRAD86]
MTGATRELTARASRRGRALACDQTSFPMSGFVPINRPDRKTTLPASTAPPKEELPGRIPRTSGSTPQDQREPASAASSTKEQIDASHSREPPNDRSRGREENKIQPASAASSTKINTSSSKEGPDGKIQEREETGQDKQAQKVEKSLEQPAVTSAQVLASSGQNEDGESDEDSLPRLRTRRPRGQSPRSSAAAASDSEESRTPPRRRLRRPQRLPSPQPTQSPSPAPTSTPPVQLEDRNWAVLGIAGARKCADIEQYLTIWGNTTHRLPTLQANANGTYSIEVDGRICEIEDFDKPHVPGDDTELQVRWKQEWLYTWELSDARRTVVEFNLGRGAGPVLDPDHVAGYHSPEPEADTTKRCKIDFAAKLRFTPHTDEDYTASLMWRCIERCEQRANHDKLSDYFMRTALDELPRQRLVLRPRWRTDEKSDEYNDVLELREEVLLRACLNYVVGQARRTECSYCQEHCGPFRRCVTRAANHEGACTNCALAGRSRQCEYYIKGLSCTMIDCACVLISLDRWAHEDKLRAAADPQTPDSRSQVTDDADDDLEEDLYYSSPLPASGPQAQHANRSAFLTPPISSPPQNLFAGAVKADASGRTFAEVSDLATSLLESLGDQQLPAGKDRGDTDSATLANLFGDNASASLENDTTLQTGSGPEEGHSSRAKSDVSARPSPEARRKEDAKKEGKAIKRKHSTSSIDLLRQNQPRRQHKVARTAEQAETESTRPHVGHDHDPPPGPSGDDDMTPMTSRSRPDGNESQQPSALNGSSQSLPIRSAALVHPPSHCEAGTSAPHKAASAAKRGHDPDPHARLAHKRDRQRPHAHCSPRGPCIDPVLNPPLPRTEHESPVVIYRDRDQLFAKSELTTPQVRYLLSLTPCNMIDCFTRGWHEFAEELKGKKGFGPQYNKEWFLSRSWTRELNQIVRDRCPLDPRRLGRPVVIDLTMDD